MPIYEFQCDNCNTVFEELVRMGSTGEGLSCPDCQDTHIRKRMSTFYGRSSSGNGAAHSVGGGCSCGGNCGSCGGGCSCHH
jgi:putative FmdB family regulatory protein